MGDKSGKPGRCNLIYLRGPSCTAGFSEAGCLSWAKIIPVRNEASRCKLMGKLRMAHLFNVVNARTKSWVDPGSA